MFQISDRRFNRLAFGGLIAAFVLLVAALAAVTLSISLNQDAAQRVRRTYQVTDALSQLNLQLERAESGRRGYLVAPTQYRSRLYRENSALAPHTLNRIALLVRDNPAEVENVRRLKQLVEKELEELKVSMALVRSGRADQARSQFIAASNSATIIRDVRDLGEVIRTNEEHLLAERIANTEHTQTITRIVLTSTGVLLFVIGAAVFWLVRRYTKDLTRARDRLSLLNANLEGAVAERTADLQRANDEIQRFAYIVSHDLRSPLVNILGFTAELEQTNKSLGGLIERAQKEAPQIITDDTRDAQRDLPEAIGFIRTSTQKMDRLINAILKLSREGRRNLVAERLPMVSILGEVAASLQHRASDAGATILIEEPMPDMVSDRVAVEQIFSNLIENAIKYLKPGRPGEIKVRGKSQGRRLFFEVEDNGRGIDAKDHQRIFDLFRRSGPQDQPGEGIGLAHVRALAYRLGGTVEVFSELGEGTTFRLNLPVTYSDRGSDN